jgi:hypothetical protein
VSLFVRRPDWQWCGAVESSEGVLGAEPTHLGGFTDDLGRGQWAAADDGQQRWRNQGDALKAELRKQISDDDD